MAAVVASQRDFVMPLRRPIWRLTLMDLGKYENNIGPEEGGWEGEVDIFREPSFLHPRTSLCLFSDELRIGVFLDL
jgi:hypothetical protein